MIKVNILYPNKAGSRFDLEYYFNTHMPMSIEKLGTALRGVSALKVGADDVLRWKGRWQRGLC
ncbi:MAG TPA: hypothetical protein VIX17_18895 [Pyrinomonadaceae bacterium]|jgi:hypothetical protein